MKTIRINARGAGKWADPNTLIPQITVEEGDVVKVSNELADAMVPNNAKDITVELAEEDARNKQKATLAKKQAANRAAKDKAAADKKKAEAKANKAAEDKEKAETK